MVERVLVPGAGSGPVMTLDEPLSLWGGFDPASGLITDRRHPQVGESLAGVVLAMAYGRGSSGGSSGLVEAARLGTGPTAIVMREPDDIVVVGAVVAEELYGTPIPVLAVDEAEFAALSESTRARIDRSGRMYLD